MFNVINAVLNWSLESVTMRDKIDTKLASAFGNGIENDVIQPLSSTIYINISGIHTNTLIHTSGISEECIYIFMQRTCIHYIFQMLYSAHVCYNCCHIYSGLLRWI